jgi:DNA-binding transcriptional MerR regulator
MASDKERVYRVREFAELAGVTVRTLHHYDRLGLLRPRRTASGYRAYVAADLEALSQIVALRFIGVPLKHIGALRRTRGMALSDALRAQKRTLEERRRLLELAIEAIAEAETRLQRGEDADVEMFRRIIKVIEMQNNQNWKDTYETYTRAKVERLQAMSPEALADLKLQWTVLVQDIKLAITDDPASPRAQGLATRWISLLSGLMGQPVPPSDVSAHHSAGSWSPQMASFVEKPVWDFMTRVLASRA